MDVNKMLAELRQEREQIEEAIIILERLARGRGKRRGRPPLWMAQTAPQTAGSPAGQQEQAEGRKSGRSIKGGLHYLRRNREQRRLVPVFN